MTRPAVVATAAVLLVLLCAVPSLSGGVDHLLVGVRLGVPWSSFSYDGLWGEQHTDYDYSFTGGLVLELPLGDSRNLSLVSGVLYVARDFGVDGGTVLDEHGAPIGTVDFSWEYLSVVVPLNVKYSFATNRLSPYVAGGAEIGIPARVKVSTWVSPYQPGDPGTGNPRYVKDDARPVEVALAVAAGLDFPIGGSLSGFVEVGYVYGLMDLWKDDSEEFSHRTLTVSGGLMY